MMKNLMGFYSGATEPEATIPFSSFENAAGD